MTLGIYYTAPKHHALDQLDLRLKPMLLVIFGKLDLELDLKLVHLPIILVLKWMLRPLRDLLRHVWNHLEETNFFIYVPHIGMLGRCCDNDNDRRVTIGECDRKFVREKNSEDERMTMRGLVA
jgi:hypothetical protein